MLRKFIVVLIFIISSVSLRLTHASDLPAITKIKVLWRVHDGRKIALNEDYLRKAPDSVKAILAYISALAGTECWWDKDQPDRSMTNLKCKLTWALGLGFQGSNKYKDFLHYWFRHDPQLSKFDDFNAVPYTATNQNFFDYINLQSLGRGEYAIEYKTSWINSHDEKGGYEINETRFRVYSDQVTMISNKLLQQGKY